MAERDERINPRFCALPILPHELIVQILSWLPVRSLIRFRCVSKSFKSLISDPQFIDTHLRKIKCLSEKNPTFYQRVALIKCYEQSKFFCSCSLDSLINDSETDSNELEQFPFKDKLGSKYYFWVDFVGSCDGLVCSYAKDCHSNRGKTVLVLCNPSRRFVYNIHDLDPEFMSWTFSAYGLGYDSKMNDYKIVVMLRREGIFIVPRDNRVVIFSQRTKCWRWIDGFRFVGPERVIMNRGGTYINGTLCWASKSRKIKNPSWIIVSFNLATETFSEFPLPNNGDLKYGGCYLSVLDGCLACTCYSRSHADVWVMKEFGVRESWTKLAIAPSAAIQFWWRNPLYMANSGEILLTDSNDRLFIYDSKNDMLRTSKINGTEGVSAAITYSESLVSLEVEN